jgi:hypothetical protein
VCGIISGRDAFVQWFGSNRLPTLGHHRMQLGGGGAMLNRPDTQPHTVTDGGDERVSPGCCFPKREATRSGPRCDGVDSP